MSDPRFSRIKTDPRFRRPKNKQRKVLVDDRFKSLFQQSKKLKEAANDTPQVDKYGRKLSKTHEEDNLKKYYRLDEDPDEAGDKAEKIIDYARGQVIMESSDEEDDSKHPEGRSSDESDVDEIVRIGADDELEVDLDEDAYAELDAQVAAYAKVNKHLEGKEDAGIANRTSRLAVVNLDWDHVRASHLYKIFSSLLSPTAPYVPVSVSSTAEQSENPKTRKSTAVPLARGSILSVRIYPSEFGKKRMEREEMEGPPAEIFKKKRKDTDVINERTIYEIGDEDEYNADALRQYQLERLRYYYAIVECDTVEVASHLYNQLDGTELERSANIFDLSFVPDDMIFDVDARRDEATGDVSSSYKPLDFATDALRHSKVKLTWDEDDPERYQITRRQLTRKEVEEDDFRTYIATSSSESEDEGDMNQTGEKNEASRRRLRALLLDGNDHALPEGWNNEDDGDVDMEITFTPALSEQKHGEDETTIEKYKRKIREKRKKEKEAHTEKKVKEGSNTAKKRVHQNDEFFNFGSDSEDVVEETGNTSEMTANHRTPSTTKLATDELAVNAIPDDTKGPEPKHFNIKTILRVEKGKKRRTGRAKESRKDEENELQEDFRVDVQDERFKVLHEDHQFAIDPTNPHFQKTQGMKAFLEERKRRQKGTRGESAVTSTTLRMKDGGEASLQSLVESVKRKSRDGHHSKKRLRQQ